MSENSLVYVLFCFKSIQSKPETILNFRLNIVTQRYFCHRFLVGVSVETASVEAFLLEALTLSSSIR